MHAIVTLEFEEAALLHLNALFQTALRLTSDRGNAAQVVRETLASALESFDSLRKPVAQRVWLFKILMQKMRRGTRSVPASKMPADEIVSALDRIPRNLREIILLVDCQDFSYQDAAVILSLSADAIAEGVVQGRQHLRSMLGTV